MVHVKFLSEQQLNICGGKNEDVFAETFEKGEVIETSVLYRDDDFLSLGYPDGRVIFDVPTAEIEILDGQNC